MRKETTQLASFGKVYGQINQHLVMLHLSWSTYQKLFINNAAHLKLIAECLPGLGWLLKQVLIETVVTGICRLCDPATQGKNENLSFQRLKTSLIPSPNAEQLAQLEGLLEQIDAAANLLRQYRNKRIAHIDLEHSIRGAQLPVVTRRQIDEVLKLMRDLMNGISHWHNAGETNYSDVINLGGTESLIRYLQQSNRLRELQDDCYFGRLGETQIIEKLKDRKFQAGEDER